MRIGVLGAGQLGRMLALAGYPLGLDFVFMDPSASACAAPLGEHIHADYDDEHALTEFCHRVDRATFEFENVPAPAARFVAERTTLLPDVAALGGFQDRLEEKQRFSDLGIALAPFAAVDSAATLSAAIDTIGLPAVLKTRRLGYDGKGQAVLRSADDVAPAWEALGGQALVLEAFVPFDREVSILAVRGCDGATAFYPLVENVHRDGILRTSRPRAEDPMQARAEQAASRVLDAFDYVGVMASNSSCAAANCSPTRLRRGSTIPATGPSRAPSAASSRTTCGRSPACRWAAPRCAAPARWSTSSAARRRPRRWRRFPACTSTTTARPPSHSARSATRRSPPTPRPNWIRRWNA